MTRYLTLSLLLTSFALPVAHAEEPFVTVQPVAPTCAKKVSKQVMSGGVLKTVMVDNAACLTAWVAYSEAFASYEVASANAAAAAFQALPSGTNGVSPTLGPMIWIPTGTFTMGSPSSEGGRREDEVQHRVALTNGYWLMEHEVTQVEWQSVIGSNPSYFTSCGPTCPVENVSWYDANVFAQRASARDGVTYTLPTEAQWEYAARGGQDTMYEGSNAATELADPDPEATAANLAELSNIMNELSTLKAKGIPSNDPKKLAILLVRIQLLGDRAKAVRAESDERWQAARQAATAAAAARPVTPIVGWIKENSGSTTHAVCGQARNGYGLCDMSGNVLEWTADWYDGYSPASATDPTGAVTGSIRVFRGGSWSSTPQDARSANRGGCADADRYASLGFRLARTSP